MTTKDEFEQEKQEYIDKCKQQLIVLNPNNAQQIRNAQNLEQLMGITLQLMAEAKKTEIKGKRSKP